MRDQQIVDDRKSLCDAESVTMEWPSDVPRPRCGIVIDPGPFPRWTKYRRFLEYNSFAYDIYDIHHHEWLQAARRFDAIIGICSSDLWALQELREKYYVLGTALGISTFPSWEHALLYEDKKLEAYIAEVYGLPFARTYISYNKDDALRLASTLAFPVISKVVPGSGSVGVELVRDLSHCRKIVDCAFSTNGRKTHRNYFRQKNYVYFQEFIPNDGYDIRVIVVGRYVFGYYRKVPRGEFRASGMGLVEKRALPPEAIDIAQRLNAVIRSPMLVVDIVHAVCGDYRIIEYSPVCQMEFPEQLHVDRVPGMYVFSEAGDFHFEAGKYWVHELAIREFLLTYLSARTGAVLHGALAHSQAARSDTFCSSLAAQSGRSS